MLLTDIRQAIRSLLRIPGFTVVCIITLALGIGATTSIFSAYYHTLLRPMPFDGGDRLAYVWVQDSVSGMATAPPHEYLDIWTRELRTIDATATFSSGEYALVGTTDPEVMKGSSISRGLPAMLSVAPVLGRTFTEEEMQLNGPNVVLLSEGLWRRRFGGERSALGRQVEMVDGTKYEIVGVLPNAFAAFEGTQREGQLWFPLRRDTGSALRDVNLLIKLREGVAREAALAELKVLSSGVEAEMGMPGKWAPAIMTPQEFVDGTTQKGLPIILIAVAAVLLIGCANIAGLFLVRLNSRSRELSIRAAIGARRATILRLIGVEAMLLAVAGGSLGILTASWLTTAIRTIRPENLNSLDAIRMDGAALAFAVCVSLVTALFFGVAPAVTTVRKDLTDGLITGISSSGRTTSGNRIRSTMVTGQIALSLILLVCSLLLVRSVRELRQKDLGFDPSNVLTMRLNVSDALKGKEATQAFYDELLPALRKIPGAAMVSASTSVPSKGGVMLGELEIPGRTLSADETTRFVQFAGGSDDFARVIGLRFVEGRPWQKDDAPGAVLINEKWARKLWPTERAVGKQFRLGKTGEYKTIVGVVEDVATMGATLGGMDAQLYMPMPQGFGDSFIAIRTDGRDAGSLTSAVRAVVRSVQPRVVTQDVNTLEALMADAISLNRFYMLLLSSFAGLALLLSAIGLYGVISNAVVQRTREIGVRMALGATPGEINSLVLRHGLRLTGFGLAFGLVGAFWLTRFLESALQGFDERDPVSFISATVFLAVAALVATWIPSRRAVRIDPLDALRAE